MRKLTILCDCCGKEMEENEVFKLEHYIHVSPSYDKTSGHCRVVEGVMQPTSGRMETRDFCLPCYNLLFTKLFEIIKEIRQ